MKQLFSVIIFSMIIISSTFAEEANPNQPIVTALIRTKAEQNLSVSRMNFYIRNARIGLKGKINDYLSYKMELDWQDEEEDQIQDIKLVFTPVKNFAFSIGQFKVPFANDYQRNPADYSFANRNFITKRMCKNLRDIGIMASYKLNDSSLFFFPVTFHIGAFNGNGAFSLEKNSKKSVGAKIELMPFKNGSISLSTHNGEVKANDSTFYNTNLYNISFTQKLGNFFIDAEIGKKLVDDNEDTAYDGFYICLAYDLPVTLPIFTKITPAIRYDVYNKYPDKNEESPRRISAGLTFHIKENNNAYIRLDYEKYDFKSGADVKSDKITMEYVVRI